MSDALKQLWSRGRQFWDSRDRTQRMLIVAAVIGCALMSVLTSYWAATPDYVTLISELKPADAHEIVGRLQAESISYELNFAGSAISVPAGDVSRARLAIRELGHETSEVEEEAGFEWWADPSQQRVRQQRLLERRLAASIEQMEAVEHATVHVTGQVASPFIRDRSETKASVVLELARGASFSPADAEAVVTLVSHAVENLDPQNTIVVDTDGHVLSSNDASGNEAGGQLDFRRSLETNLASRAESMLTSVLGHGHAIVRVTADVDFKETNSSRTTYSPDDKVKSRESISTETTRAGGSDSDGVASAAVGNPASSQGDNLSEIETIDTEFQNSETIETVREAPGRIVRLTVAAVVELPDAPTDPAATASSNQPTLLQITNIIKQAVGFDPARNDEIEVMNSKISGAVAIVPPPAWLGVIDSLAPHLGSVALAFASLVAFVLGWRVINRLKPVVVEVDRSVPIDPEVRARLADLSEELLQHPEAVSAVLAGWLSAQNSEPTQDAQPTRRAA